VQYFGVLELEEFKDVITFKEYVACINAKKKNFTWYPLKIDVFESFLYKVFADFIVFFCFVSLFFYSLTCGFF